jgi:uncharacterized membrane protein YgcG
MDLVFLVFAAITGVMVFLAVQQSKIKKQIDEDRRKRGDDALLPYGGADPMMTGLPPGMPPDVSPGPPSPHPSHPPPTLDAGGRHGGDHSSGGFDGGTHHGGGFDGGGGDGGGGHH